MDFFKNDAQEELIQRLKVEETANLVMESLDEALLATGKHGFKFMNKKGFEVVEQIQHRVLEAHVERHPNDIQFQKSLVLKREDFKSISATRKKEVEVLSKILLKTEFLEIWNPD